MREGTVLWKDGKVKPGHEYLYYVLSYNIYKAASPESNRLQVFWVDPLPPPSIIDLRQDDRALEIHWQTPAHLWKEEEKKEFQGMNIYRYQEGESFGFSPLNDQPLKEEKYWDGRVEIGKKYFYEVRPVRNFRGTLIEGLGSPLVAGVAEKILPPAAPTGLVGVFQKEGIALRWDSHPEPEVAGYDVYRRGEDEREFKKINSQLLTEPYFLDTSVDPKKTYFYRLKAIASPPAQKESEFSREAEVIPQLNLTPQQGKH